MTPDSATLPSMETDGEMNQELAAWRKAIGHTARTIYRCPWDCPVMFLNASKLHDHLDSSHDGTAP